jgi:phosphate starvation-inducible protein PhoH and related proteins
MSKKRQKMDAVTAPTNTIQFDRQARKSAPIIVPRNIIQEEYLDLLKDPRKHIVFAAGPAGTGKTLLAMMAGIQALKEGEVNRLILTRPAVGVEGESHGYLPGDLTSKMLPWTQPLMDVLRECYDVQQIEQMIQNQVIELAALSFLRGRTFKNGWIVFDEAQNSSMNQMKMILTRIGEGSKIIVTGDLAQKDKPFAKDNGFKDFLERIPVNDSMIGCVTFDQRHIERHAIVSRVLSLYGD